MLPPSSDAISGGSISPRLALMAVDRAHTPPQSGPKLRAGPWEGALGCGGRRVIAALSFGRCCADGSVRWAKSAGSRSMWGACGSDGSRSNCRRGGGPEGVAHSA